MSILVSAKTLPRDAIRASPASGPAVSYFVERCDGAQGLLTALAGAPDEATVFQTRAWLTPLIEVVSTRAGARPLALVVRAARTGELAMILPLVEFEDGGIRVAAFPSFGLSDYGGPILGPAAPADAAAAAALRQSILDALDGTDVLRLENMPAAIEGRPNPLTLTAGVTVSRHSSHRLDIPGTIEERLKERGKRYKKEVARSYRLLEKEGPWSFTRAEISDEITAIYAVLEEQQRARRAGEIYRLDRPGYARFYERIVREGTPCGRAHLFALKSGDEIIATLLGVTHRGVFTALRITSAGERWSHVSPGRLIAVEAMRYFLGRGVRRFDFGIGDYAFKDRIGASPASLTDLIVPLTWRGWPAVVASRVRAWVRRNPRLAAFLRVLKGGP